MVESGVTPVHEAARRQGLGEVERIYRERNPLSEGPTYAIVTATVAAVLAGAVPDTRWRLPVLLLGPVLGAGLVAAYVFLGKVSGVQRRRLIGVSPAGVLIHTDGGGSIALRWDQIKSVVRQDDRYRYAIAGDDRFEFRDVQDGRSLVASIEAKRPKPAPVRRRALIGTAVGVVVAFLGWLSFDAAFGVKQADRLPTDLRGFVDACEEPGTAFTRAARYAHAGLRPVVIFIDGDGPAFTGSGPWGPDTPAEVQVIMCAHRSGQGESVHTCDYQDRYGESDRTLTMYEARYEVTAYRARTREVVRVRTLVGARSECPAVTRTSVEELYTGLTDWQIRESMGDIVGTV